MILIRLMGGLGNQMFQYAFGKRMALINNTKLVLDQSLLLDKSLPHEIATHRDFELDIFNLKNYRWATTEEIFSYNGDVNASFVKKAIRKIKNTISPKKVIIQNGNEFNPDFLKTKSDVCFVGRWQSEIYFNDVSEEIKKEFTFVKIFSAEIENYKTIIQENNAVCLHIRRGDLITSPIYSNTIGVLSWDYYEKAMAHIKERVVDPVFFIFSDDIEWCKQNIILSEQTYYLDDSTADIKAQGHLYLMQQCKHFIISNSTFAWWGAWLSTNKDKIVIAPKKWFADSSLNSDDIIPKQWIKF